MAKSPFVHRCSSSLQARTPGGSNSGADRGVWRWKRRDSRGPPCLQHWYAKISVAANVFSFSLCDKNVSNAKLLSFHSLAYVPLASFVHLKLNPGILIYFLKFLNGTGKLAAVLRSDPDGDAK